MTRFLVAEENLKLTIRLVWHKYDVQVNVNFL